MSLPKPGDEHARPERMTDVLARLQGELEEIAARIDRNQALIAKSTWAIAAGDADYVKAMQDADLSAQRIAGVAGYLRALCDASRPDWHIDTAAATGSLKLTELVRSIGPADIPIQPKDEAEAGNVDLF